MTALAVAAALVAGLFLCEWALAVRRRHIAAAMSLRDSFFTAAEALVRDAETPESVVALLEACAGTITRSDIGRLMIRRALVNRLPDALVGDEDDAESARFLRDVHALREPSRRLLAEAAMHYAQAISFNNTLLGVFVRRWSAAWLAGPPAHRVRQAPERRMIDVTPRLLGEVRAAVKS